MSKSEGWGLITGLDTLWKLPYNFGFFGNAKYGISRSKFYSGQNQQTTVLTQPQSDLQSVSTFHALTHNIQLKTGFNWNYQLDFQNHPLDLNLYIAYEMSLWMQNVQLTRILSLGTGFSDANTTNIGNVGFRGLTTGFNVGF